MASASNLHVGDFQEKIGQTLCYAIQYNSRLLHNTSLNIFGSLRAVMMQLRLGNCVYYSIVASIANGGVTLSQRLTPDIFRPILSGHYLFVRTKVLVRTHTDVMSS